MTKQFRRSLVAAALALLVACSNELPEQYPEEHVSFLVAGKTTNYRQEPDLNDEVELLNYHFFAEIFLKPGKQVKNSKVVFPGDGSQAINFEPDSEVLEAHGGRYMTKASLDKDYPAGKYTFVYELPAGKKVNQPVPLRESGKMRLPQPVIIKLFQNDKRVHPSSVTPDQDLHVKWSDFSNATPDPNDIVDDLIFVFMGNCSGKKLAHSGGPFGDENFLTYRDDSYVIPSQQLKPGTYYQLAVEHAALVTNKKANVPGLATFATTSFLDFRTRGLERADCPGDGPEPIDRGQTDRYDASSKFQK